jgi:DNA-binding NarL/FixJ family response regulator
MPLKTLLICDEPVTAKDIEALIAREPSLTLLETTSAAQAQNKTAQLQPQLVWIDLNDSPVRGLALLAELKHTTSALHVFVSSKKNDPEIIRTAFRLKASDVFDADLWVSELPMALLRIADEKGLDSANKSFSSAPDNQPLKTLLVSEAEIKKRSTIEDLIHSQKTLNLVSSVSTVSAEEKVRIMHPRVVWIDLSPDPDRGLALLTRVKSLSPKTHVFVSYDTPRADLIKSAYRLGAADFLDAERWRTDLPAALKAIRLQTMGKAAKTSKNQSRFVVIGAALILLLCYLLSHH